MISVLYQNASTSRILEPSPQGLISSEQILQEVIETLNLFVLLNQGSEGEMFWEDNELKDWQHSADDGSLSRTTHWVQINSQRALLLSWIWASIFSAWVVWIPRSKWSYNCIQRYTVAVYSWSIANNIVIDVYCRCLEILCQIAFSSIANYFRSYRKKQFGIKSIGIYSRHQ